MRGLGLIGATALVAVLGAPGVAAAQRPAPTLATADGPATLQVVDRRPVPAFALVGSVATGVRVTVGAGSRAGRVRPWYEGRVAGPWSDLPAEAGTYVVPIDPVATSDPFPDLGLDQESGGLRIVRDEGSDPTVELRTFAGDPPPGRSGTPTTAEPGRSLALEPVVEADRDADLVPDARQQTDLAVTLARSGERTLAATISNRGPRTAPAPVLELAGAAEAEVAGESCDTSEGPLRCRATPLLPGASVVVELTVRRMAGTLTAAVSSSAPDLAPADDVATLVLAATANAGPITRPLRQPKLVALPARQRLRDGALRVTLDAASSGVYVVLATATARGRSIAVRRRVVISAGAPRAVRVRFSRRQAAELLRDRPRRGRVVRIRVSGADGVVTGSTRLVG